jgi:hypothetical protein
MAVFNGTSLTILKYLMSLKKAKKGNLEMAESAITKKTAKAGKIIMAGSRDWANIGRKGKLMALDTQMLQSTGQPLTSQASHVYPTAQPATP